VKYARKGEAYCGWILKVYADTAHVVPSSATVGDDSEMLPFKGNETQPWPCEKRGEAVMVFAGPRRGSKGKVIGFEGDSVYVRLEHVDKGKHTLLFASAAGSDLVRVQRTDVTLFNQAWVGAAEERRKLPPARTEKVPDKPTTDSDADSMAWLGKASEEGDKQGPPPEPRQQEEVPDEPAKDPDADRMAWLHKPSVVANWQAPPQDESGGGGPWAMQAVGGQVQAQGHSEGVDEEVHSEAASESALQQQHSGDAMDVDAGVLAQTHSEAVDGEQLPQEGVAADTDAEAQPQVPPREAAE